MAVARRFRWVSLPCGGELIYRQAGYECLVLSGVGRDCGLMANGYINGSMESIPKYGLNFAKLT